MPNMKKIKIRIQSDNPGGLSNVSSVIIPVLTSRGVTNR